MGISAIVFDLDGTLVDSRRDIAEATNHALLAAGKSALSVDEIASYVGDGARTLISRAAHIAEDSPEIAPLLADFLDYYTRHATDHSVLLPHAREVLDALCRELPLALLTNKPRKTTEAVLAGLDLRRYFRAVGAGGDLPQKKPDPAPLLALCAELDIAPSGVVVVGDGPQDIACGRAAGARTVGVRGGINPTVRLEAAHPDAVIADLGELSALLRDWQREA